MNFEDKDLDYVKRALIILRDIKSCNGADIRPVILSNSPELQAKRTNEINDLNVLIKRIKEDEKRI